MYGWYIAVAILLLLLAAALLRIRIRFLYNEQELAVYLYILCFRYRLYPKQKRVKIKHYTYKRYRRRLLAQREKQRKKQGVKGTSKKESKKKKPLRESLRVYTYLVKKLYLRFLHHFRIDVARLHITVATGDAAQTAIAYGFTCQTVACLLELLQNHTNFHRTYRAQCAIEPDFIGEKSHASCDVSFSLRVFEIVDLGIRFFYHILISRMHRQTANSSNKEEKTWQKVN